ncbi:Fic family protein [Dyadobacter sp. CY312]|uniref:Fic family protein n=1 Tax=Dyadobacter sp. CY312 TaxID=2907303 RepID=UPI001F19BD89|nr:Fic family protein [Dyadobacter sp. CY312]MCE7043591.1 Fic family protein [Dyadobacter sp. CY312]
MTYNWELPDWPNFRYSLNGIESLTYRFALETGEINGLLKSLPEHIRQELLLEIMLLEAIKTSKIEGEFLSRQDVMSSIRNNLGLNVPQEKVKDKQSQGMGELMVSLRTTYQKPLTAEQLFIWHEMILGSSLHIRSGQWRTGTEPMQIISGSTGKEKVHFQAPPSSQVVSEMEAFIKWFNETAPDGTALIGSALVRAAIVHLYFETIHPFEDGNGRIGRALAEKALAQTSGQPLMLSLSRTIEADKKSYYEALETAQKHNEISAWIQYFSEVVLNAQIASKKLIDFTLQKTKVFDQYATQLNERQIKVTKKMLEAGEDGFEGGMSAKKYMSIAKTSKATATRDLQNLLENGVVKVEGGGRSVRYTLVLK